MVPPTRWVVDRRTTTSFARLSASVGEMTRATRSYYALGTRVTLMVDAPDPDALLGRTVAFVGEYEELLSANLSSSEIGRINQAAGIAPVEVSPAGYRLVRESVLVSRSDKGFNVAIGPLVQAWRIGFDDAREPSAGEVEKARQLIDPQQIRLDDDAHSVFLERVGMRLDLGAIAKGYIADAIAEVWRRAPGFRRGVIDLGGNVVTVGRSPHPDGRWRVGVQSPLADRGHSLGTLALPACSVVTTGSYERTHTANGRTWHHILDPRTGYPLETDLVSVTAVTASSTTAEIWSTIGFFNGARATLELIPPGLEIGFVFVTRDRTIHLSPGLADSFTLTDDGYSLSDCARWTPCT